MEVLRTPDERFDGLADYPFAPHYREVTAADGTVLRMHFIDEGPADAAPVLLLHGNPSWCYLYRHMVPGLVARGHRVLAPDLVGLGPVRQAGRPGRLHHGRHTSTGWASGSGRRTCGGHAVLPGLGRHRSASSCCPATATASTGSSPPTPACPRAGA